ncbi:GNAT family N-acetyltransferase [Alkalicoccobacillus murimartini]|uniref:GNAT superfamily N-acetyltransferase n=1 Tax=Alkalicoccobacillus murimartini TaxID=171685 RepID=A0ABT9YM02_9BACI|nr:GNAT family N-acetyltransferase [Alkalicoccobacillus murimartini]MDQ0208674.1 GNAT superfamily N-acetyltransferase [Alkalicoccobacillus murimartini]
MDKIEGKKELKILPFDKKLGDIEELTYVLNRAYKQLAEMGLKYVASHQDSSITLERIEHAHCLVAMEGEKIVGTISFYPPGSKMACDWYRKEGIGVIGQFGVLPELQGAGLGTQLLDEVELYAHKQIDVNEVSLDTAEKADHLITMYAKRGYKFVEYVDWDMTNYRSVIMSKSIK